MILVHGISKSFGGRLAVDALSLDVKPGELYALLGPNGAGKSTTIQCILGFLRPDQGAIKVGGVDVLAEPQKARALTAFIPEQVSVYPQLTGVENLRYFSGLAGRPLRDREARELLGSVGLQEAAHGLAVAGYSKGMRQKVGIAIALAKNAKALLLDEPTSGLDPSASHEFSKLLANLRSDGVAILMATHDLFRAREDASRLGIVRHGRLCREVAARDITAGALEALYLEVMAD